MIFTILYSWFLITCSYFCLWIISDYLLSDIVLACLFLPFALRSGIILHIQPKFWPIVYCSEISILILLNYLFPEIYQYSIFILSICSIPIIYLSYLYYSGNQWKKLSIQLSTIVSISMINAVAISSSEFYFTFLVSFTGGVLIVPACYLINEFLFKTEWLPLTSSLIKKPVTLRIKHIFIYILLFVLNIYIQMKLPDTFYRFALFYFAIPIILLAFQYGWQGAFLGVLLNSIALIGTTHSFSNLTIADLLLSISTQTITGIFLGLAIQDQRNLNQSLSIELNKNRLLTRQLINTEETIRQEISRELHDEVGQNITAIRTQANILKRIAPNYEKISTTIEQLSLNIYDTTKVLLNRIRPRLLDDLDLPQAIENLFIELNFQDNQIDTELIWKNDQNLKLEHILEITIYRLCQESLNNIIKYAKANKVKIEIEIKNNIHIIITDNGVGFDTYQILTGFGIRGMQERVNILCGTFEIISIPIEKNPIQHGTTLIVNLPYV
ncbi:signal transduction histidine-protein kinase/phosphatase UhpB [Glaesserella parasuis]|uniref:signal transduction histidine-protein kinase/phosphatase UhpB n=1 Tax=Glaesserella parasuis TaxID=738 RepID=UPI0024373AAC|nr:signal transduction histidine-protein kinase/phosphatase UhpB [Glaesserella parasuis]MDG6855204.1 signal transduction histidine-protein kinase/phosphatase UhpB [Glaesserella parasuis]